MVTAALPAPETVAVASVGVPTQTLALPAQAGVPKVTAVTARSLAANSGQSLSVTAVHTCENGAPLGHVAVELKGGEHAVHAAGPAVLLKVEPSLHATHVLSAVVVPSLPPAAVSPTPHVLCALHAALPAAALKVSGTHGTQTVSFVRSPMGEGSSPAGHSLCATHLANSHFRPTHFSSDAIAWVVYLPASHVTHDLVALKAPSIVRSPALHVA